MADKGQGRDALEERTGDEPERIRIGWQPSYPGAYAAAWARLLPGSAQLALPTLYLQRHTFELLLKDLLMHLLDLRYAESASADLFGGPAAGDPDASGDCDAVTRTHDLSQLSCLVTKSLAALRLPQLPSTFDEVRRLLDEIEEGSPERLRYATVRDRRSHQMVPSFDLSRDGEGKTAAIDRIGALLWAILSWASTYPSETLANGAGPAATMRFFFDSISDHDRRIACRISIALHELEVATREGKLEWSFTDGMSAVEQRPDLAPVADVIDPRCRFAWHRGRGFALFASTGNGGTVRDFFLASLGGCLGQGIWLRRYESGLGQAVWESHAGTSPSEG